MFQKRKIEKTSFLLFAIWMILSWEFTFLNILVGGILSVFIGTLSKNVYYSHLGYHLHFPPILKFLLFFSQVLRQIVLSSWRSLRLYGKREIQPKVFSYRLTTKEPLKIAFLANAITMTPGTVTVDIQSGELKVLSFHHNEEKTLQEDIYQGLERYIV